MKDIIDGEVFDTDEMKRVLTLTRDGMEDIPVYYDEKRDEYARVLRARDEFGRDVPFIELVGPVYIGETLITADYEVHNQDLTDRVSDAAGVYMESEARVGPS